MGQTMSDEDVEWTQFNFRVQETALDTAKHKTEHGELSKEMRREINRIAFGADVSEHKRLKEERQDLVDKRDTINKKITNLTQERDEIDRKIERIDSRLDSVTDMEGKYEGHLESIAEDMRDGMNVFVGHGKIETAASVLGKDEEEVIADIKERNPDIDESQFEDAWESGTV